MTKNNQYELPFVRNMVLYQFKQEYRNAGTTFTILQYPLIKITPKRYYYKWTDWGGKELVSFVKKDNHHYGLTISKLKNSAYQVIEYAESSVLEKIEFLQKLTLRFNEVFNEYDERKDEIS